jgi:hypothetical protein
MGALAQLGVGLPLQVDPAERPQGSRQGVAGTGRAELAQDDGGHDPPGLD